MAIQMRRGLLKDFNPNKMLPGEWAVSIDPSTSNQIVWMCFAPGVCKRMGTYEDFAAQIAEITADIREDLLAIAEEVSSDKEEVLVVKSDIVNTYLPDIQRLAEIAEERAAAAEKSADNANAYATEAESYARGGTGSREGEDADNARYYYEQTKQISQGINGVVPMGTVTFANLPTSDIVDNAMYNVSDAFTSDSRFNDGGGIYYGPGNNVIWTAEGKWDVTASSNVTGIKGAAESTYRQGNVNITPENIGLGNVDNTSDIDKPISTAAQEAFDALNAGLDAKKIFFGLDSVGMALTNTLQEVYNAMPDDSMLKLHVTNSSTVFQQSLPTNNAGEVVIYKGNSARGWVEFRQDGYGDLWRNHYYSSTFQGWDSFVLNSDLEAITPSARSIDNIYLAGNGGSVTLTLPSKAQGMIFVFPNANVSVSSLCGVYSFGMRGASNCMALSIVEASDITISRSGLTLTFTNNSTTYNAFMTVMYSSSSKITTS